MIQPTLHHLVLKDDLQSGGQRRVAWWQWQHAACSHPEHVVLAVHGLTRQGRDFDALAQALAPHMRVVAMDVAGRGASDWLSDPARYAVPTYVADAVALIAHLQPQRLSWVGTSMGGLIGMVLLGSGAAQAHALVLNDVGPSLQWPALQRIGTYVGQAPTFTTEEQGVRHLATLHQGFGPHTPAQWLALSRPMLRPVAGGWQLHYDPAIGHAFANMPASMDAAAQAAEQALWAMYDAIGCPTLLLRGEHSDLLAPATAEAMTRRGPCATLRTVPGVGHAPTLVDVAQVQWVSDFLLAHST